MGVYYLYLDSCGVSARGWIPEICRDPDLQRRDGVATASRFGALISVADGCIA